MKANTIAIAVSVATMITGGVIMALNQRRFKKAAATLNEKSVAAIKSVMDAHPENEAVQTLGKEAIDAIQTA